MISGRLSGSAGPISASGNLGLRVHTTTQAVDQTIDVNGTPIAIKFAATDPKFAFFATDVTVSFGDFFEVHGDVTGSAGVFGGANLELFLGSGPYRLANNAINPDAVGVLLRNAKVGVINPTGGGVQLHAEGDIALIGLDGLVISGHATIDVNTSGQIVDRTITVPGDNGTSARSGSSSPRRTRRCPSGATASRSRSASSSRSAARSRSARGPTARWTCRWSTPSSR